MKRTTRLALFLIAGILLGFFFADKVLSDTGGPPVPLPSETPIIVTPEPVVTSEPTLQPTPVPTAIPTPVPTPDITPEPTVIPPPVPDTGVLELIEENRVLIEENAALIEVNSALIEKNAAITEAVNQAHSVFVFTLIIMSIGIFLLTLYVHKLYKAIWKIYNW